MGDRVWLSKFLAKLLRHDARQRGLDINEEGYVDIEEILELSLLSRFCVEDVEDVVRRDNKGRFRIRTVGIRKQIKATQGHSMKLEDPGYIPINHVTDVRSVLHGTRSGYWSSIRSEGLSRKTRTFIHFAEAERNVQSGFPPGCDMAIEIDLEKALKDGIKFYRSENGVILSPGNANGVISRIYFKQAYNIHTRDIIAI